MADKIPLKLVDNGSGSGSITEFGSADTVPVAQGGTGGNTQLTAQAALGLVKQTGVTDATAGSLLAVGAGGLLAGGNNVSPQPITDANNALANGWYSGSGTAANIPIADQFSILTVGLSSSQITQTLYYHSSGTIFTRRRYGDATTWSTWTIVFTIKTAVGTVSQSGGVPTGAIIETGTNSNGTYTKFASGLLICEGAVAYFSVPANSYTQCPTITFPATFATMDYAVHIRSTPTVSSDVYGYSYANSIGLSTYSEMYRNGASAQNIANGRYTAVGRWF